MERLANHPGGEFLFCHRLDVPHSKKSRDSEHPLTRDEANDYFRSTLTGSKREAIRGWHTFRRSFLSNCVAAGIDQRIIDEWVGHQSEAMRKRYRHLAPSQAGRAMQLVFGNRE